MIKDKTEANVDQIVLCLEELNQEIDKFQALLDQSSCENSSFEYLIKKNIEWEDWLEKQKQEFSIVKEPNISSVFLTRSVIESLFRGSLTEKEIKQSVVEICKELGVKFTGRGNITGSNLDVSTICCVLGSLGVFEVDHNISSSITNSITNSTRNSDLSKLRKDLVSDSDTKNEKFEVRDDWDDEIKLNTQDQCVEVISDFHFSDQKSLMLEESQSIDNYNFNSTTELSTSSLSLLPFIPSSSQSLPSTSLQSMDFFSIYSLPQSAIPFTLQFPLMNHSITDHLSFGSNTNDNNNNNLSLSPTPLLSLTNDSSYKSDSIEQNDYNTTILPSPITTTSATTVNNSNIYLPAPNNPYYYNTPLLPTISTKRKYSSGSLKNHFNKKICSILNAEQQCLSNHPICPSSKLFLTINERYETNLESFLYYSQLNYRNIIEKQSKQMYEVFHDNQEKVIQSDEKTRNCNMLDDNKKNSTLLSTKIKNENNLLFMNDSNNNTTLSCYNGRNENEVTASINNTMNGNNEFNDQQKNDDTIIINNNPISIPLQQQVAEVCSTPSKVTTNHRRTNNHRVWTLNEKNLDIFQSPSLTLSTWGNISYLEAALLELEEVLIRQILEQCDHQLPSATPYRVGCRYLESSSSVFEYTSEVEPVISQNDSVTNVISTTSHPSLFVSSVPSTDPMLSTSSKLPQSQQQQQYPQPLITKSTPNSTTITQSIMTPAKSVEVQPQHTSSSLWNKVLSSVKNNHTKYSTFKKIRQRHVNNKIINNTSSFHQISSYQHNKTMSIAPLILNNSNNNNNNNTATTISSTSTSRLNQSSTENSTILNSNITTTDLMKFHTVIPDLTLRTRYTPWITVASEFQSLSESFIPSMPGTSGSIEETTIEENDNENRSNDTPPIHRQLQKRQKSLTSIEQAHGQIAVVIAPKFKEIQPINMNNYKYWHEKIGFASTSSTSSCNNDVDSYENGSIINDEAMIVDEDDEDDDEDEDIDDKAIEQRHKMVLQHMRERWNLLQKLRQERHQQVESTTTSTSSSPIKEKEKLLPFSSISSSSLPSSIKPSIQLPFIPTISSTSHVPSMPSLLIRTTSTAEDADEESETQTPYETTVLNLKNPRKRGRPPKPSRQNNTSILSKIEKKLNNSSPQLVTTVITMDQNDIDDERTRSENGKHYLLSQLTSAQLSLESVHPSSFSSDD